MIIEGHTSALKRHHLERYYGYQKDTFCDFAKRTKLIIVCLNGGKNIKRVMVEENICFKPHIVETKKIDSNKYLERLRKKFENRIELDHKDCALLVHLPLFHLDISEKEYVREFCRYLRRQECIPEEERKVIIPAMYLNIEHYIGDEYEQEKLLEMVNMLKFCENAYDRGMRLAREDEAEKVEKAVTERVTKEVTENLARKLLNKTDDFGYVHEMTDLPMSRIKELKADL